MIQEWMKDLLETAKSRGFSDFEIYMESSKRFSTSIFKGELDKFSASEPSGISVRGIYNGKMGNAYTEKMDKESLDLLVEDCLTNAQISETEDVTELFAPANACGQKPINVAVENSTGVVHFVVGAKIFDHLVGSHYV